MVAQASHHPFTPEQAETIRAEWLAGTSTAQIGRLIGRTGASVTGKAHRMGLPRRQDPIKRVRTAQEAVEAAESQKCPNAARTAPNPLSGPEIDRTRVATSRPIPPTTACEYPLGQRGAYTKCGAPISRGSYCAEHAAVCYVGQKAVENAA